MLPVPQPQLSGNRGVGEGFAAPHGSRKKEELPTNQQRGIAVPLVAKVEVAWVALASLCVLSGCCVLLTVVCTSSVSPEIKPG